MNWIILISLIIIILWGSVMYKPSQEYNNLSILNSYYSSYLFDKNLEYFEEKKDGWMKGATKGILIELGAKEKTNEDINRKKELNQLKKDLKVAEINKKKEINTLNKVKRNTKILKEKDLV